ncbi:MAG: HAD family hydrolase [Nitriliruptoraceae bacterium]
MSPDATLPPGLRPGGRFEMWQPSAVRYVVADVDGTLVGPAALATPAVVAAVARAETAGIRFGYATGRMRDGVDDLHRQLGAAGPHILHNGAEVRAEGRTIASWSLGPGDIGTLLDLAAADEDTFVEIYGTSGFHVSSWDERGRAHWDLMGAEPLGLVEGTEQFSDSPIPKATFITFTDEAHRRLLAGLARLDAEISTATSPRIPGTRFTNVNRPGATKGSALVAATDHLGVSPDEVAAIGDAANDASMFAVAGTAIAMAQAEPEIREAAHLVTRSVDEDGVAAALDALIAVRALA